MFLLYLNLYELFHNHTCRYFYIMNGILVERWTKSHTPVGFDDLSINDIL